LLQARIASSEEGDARVAQLCTQAIAESGDDLLLQARSHAAFAETSPSGPETDLLHAQIAVDLLQRIDAPPPALFANALTNLALHHCRLGHGLDGPILERAVALESLGAPPPVSDRAGMALGMCLKVVDQFAESRRWLHAMRANAIEEGDDSALPNVLGHLATLECWVGDYPLALRYATEGRDQVRRMGVRAPMLSSAHVLVLAHLGRLAEARELGERDLADDQAISFESALALHLRSLGVTELFAGRVDVAATRFLAALAISRDSIGIGEPAIMRLHADAVSALVIIGDLAGAERLTGELESSSALNRLPWATAMASHCRGAISAATGDLPAAVQSLELALGEHTRLAMPFEEGRTRLLLGSVLRRNGRRSDARRQLEAAHAVFVRLATPIQAAQAQAQLAAVSRSAAAKGELTAAEGRIVSLVAAGQTSREVAGTLVMSVRTVDSHLGHIYRKLGLRSRTELAVWMALQESEIERTTP
jgi:DNA-binding CsgD family transcriptional regulator